MKNWKEEKYFYLHDIALLILGHDDPDKFNASKLLDDPPPGFDRIYRDIRLAACSHLINDYERSEELDSELILVYELRTNKAEDKKQLTPQDGMEVSAYLKDIIDWINAKKKQNPNFEDKFFTVTHTLKAEKRTDLRDRERETMIKIIHALAKNGYKYPSRGSLKDMIDDFEKNCNGVSEKTLTKYLNEFDRL